MARKISYQQAINEALVQEMRRDATVFVMGEDNAGAPGDDDAWGGVLGVTKGLYHQFPGRVLDTPLSEIGYVGAAVGGWCWIDARRLAFRRPGGAGIATGPAVEDGSGRWQGRLAGVVTHRRGGSRRDGLSVSRRGGRPHASAARPMPRHSIGVAPAAVERRRSIRWRAPPRSIRLPG